MRDDAKLMASGKILVHNVEWSSYVLYKSDVTKDSSPLDKATQKRAGDSSMYTIRPTKIIAAW